MKKYLILLQIIFIGGLMAFIFEWASAGMPSSVPNGSPEIIDTSSVNQAIPGTLKIGGASSATTGYTLEVVGNISDTAGLSVLKSNSTNGNFSADAFIKSASLSGSGLSVLCADPNGVLKRC